MASDDRSATTPDHQDDPSQQAQPNQSLGQRAREEANSAQHELRHAGEAIREEAKGLASAVRDKALDGIESGKSALADSLDDFSAAIHKASDELDDRDQQSAARLARHAASGLEQVGEAMKGRSVQDIAGSIAAFARERPTAFFLGAALAGIALGRFARASSPDEQRSGPAEYGDDNDY